MLQSLRIEGYRAFSDYRLDGLARVNLLVGKNGCGKTSVLEAVQLLASEGDPGVMTRIAYDRGEIVVESDDFEGWRSRTHPDMSLSYPDISHLFHRRLVEPPTSFAVHGDDGFGWIEVEVVGSEESGQQALFPGLESRRQGFVWVKNPERKDFDQKWAWPVRITEESVLLEDPHRLLGLRARRNRPLASYMVVGGALTPPSLHQMWNKVLTEGREEEVVHAMCLLERRTTGIFFLAEERERSSSNSPRILLAIENEQRRYPIGSYGDGMIRLLTLALAMISAKNDTLLIDEIDTGLHYSVLGDMWRLVVETARKTDVQVFATTHSLDCVRGLAWLCQSHPDLGREVSLQKIEPKLEHSVALDAGDIALAVDHGMEVR